MHVSRLLSRTRTAAVASATALILGLSAPLALAADENSLQQEESAQEVVEDDATDAPTEASTAKTKAKTEKDEKKAEPTETSEPSEDPTSEAPADDPTSDGVPDEDPAPEKSDGVESGSEKTGDSGKSDESESDEAPAGIAPLSVPLPDDDTAVVTVRTGGIRTGDSSVAALPGVVLGLYATAGAASPVNNTWAVCTADVDGDCSFEVPWFNPPGQADGPSYWVKQISAPTGYFTNPALRTGGAGAGSSTSYVFETPELEADTVYTSTSTSDGFMYATGNTNADASSGIWQQSVNNPPATQQCGLDAALLLDVSGSVSGDLPQLKTAASSMVDALVGTPSQLALHTFNNQSPSSATGGVNAPLRNVSTSGDAQAIKNDINGLSANSGTNWDQGLWGLVGIADTLDVVIVITDGNPTFYGPSAEGPGSYTRFREVENSIFSANALKAEGARIITLGVGDGLGTAASLNLRAVSGDGAYYQSESYDDAAEVVRNLALGACQNRLSVIKQTVDANGENPNVAGGWDITASGPIVDGGSVTKETAPETGGVNFDLTIPGGGSGVVTVAEDLTSQPNFEFSGVECTDTTTGNALTVADLNPATGSFTVAIPSTQTTASCTITNQSAEPASVVFEKTWEIDGTTYAHSSRPTGYNANGSVNGENVGIGSERAGFEAGDSVTVGESTTVPNDQPLCEAVVEELVSINGVALDNPIPLTGDATYDFDLEAGTNTVGLRNTQDCESRVTLVKEVQGGPADPATWTLTAVTPDGAIEGPTGTTGVTGEVSPATRYILTESGDPRYAQTIAPNAAPTPPATGSWQCSKLDENGELIPGSQYDGLNGGVTVPRGQWAECTAVNVTAELTLLKEVSNVSGGEAESSDFDLTATPTGDDVPAGLAPETVEGAADPADANTFLVRPGTPYALTESDLSGYELSSLTCVDDSDVPIDLGDGDTITVPAGEQYSCTFINDDIAPTLTLVKEIGGDGDQSLVDAWTLTATDGDSTVVSGTSGVSEDVEAGVAYTLGETLIDPDGDGQGYYQEGEWSCTDEDGADGTVTLALGQDVTCTVTNVPVEPVTIVKDAGTATQDGTDANLWTVDYTLTATNSNPVGVEYTITDSIDVPAAASVDQISVVGSPAGVTLNPAFDGQSDTLIAEDVAIGAGDPSPVNHVYTVRVVYRTTAAAGEPTGQCDPGEGHVIGNDATVTTYDLPPESDDACVTIPEDPAVTVEKIETSTTQNADGSWTITYEVVATNTSDELAAAYDAVDTPEFGDGISISSASWTGPTSGSFTGDPLTAQLATDKTLAPGLFETYTITIVAEVAGDSTPEARDCELSDGEDGTGFFNTATITVDGQDPVSDSDCSSPVVPTVTKTVTSDATPDTSVDPWAGLWTITYDVTVTNPSDETGLQYSLTDVPTPSVGTAVSAEVTGAATLSWQSTDGPFVIVPADSPTALAAGESDTYTITMSVQVPLATELPVACDDDGSGLVNTAIAVSGDFTVADDACSELPDLPSLTLVKEVENGNLTEGVADDQDWRLTANGDDDTPFDTGGLSEHTSTVLPGTYGLSETLIDDSFAGLYTASAWACTIDGQPFSGFASPDAVTLANGEDVVCTITNTLIDPVTIQKATASVTPSATTPGEWTLVYTLTVTNPNDVDATYDISDTTQLVPGATLESISVDSDDVDVSGSSFGVSDPVIAEDVTIGTGDENTHVYTVTATVTVPGTVTEPVCGNDGMVQNTGTVTMAPFDPIDSTVCDTTDDLPGVTITKDVSTDVVPAQNEDGSWTITYDVVVTNSEDDQATEYTLTDDLRFGDGITVGDATWSLADPADDGTFVDGSADLTPDGPRALAGGGTHTYTVTATGTVTDSSTATSRDCILGDGESGTGFWNSATVTASGDSTTVSACATPVLPSIDKQFSSTAQHIVDGAWDGSWDVTYEVAVSNTHPLTDIYYTLDDAPALPAGVTLNSATISGVDGEGADITVNPLWDGDGATAVIEDARVLPANSMDVYTVVVNVTADDDAEVPTSECTVGEGAVDNTATVASGGYTDSASACGPLGEISVPVVQKDATSAVQGDDGLWTVTYDVTVRNDGEAFTRYDLTDLPELPSTMSVESASWSGETSGDFTVTDGVPAEATLASGKFIAGGGATHTYTVTMIVDFTGVEADETVVCTGEPGSGFYNGVTVTTGDLTNSDSACAEPTVPTVEKSVTSEPVPYVPEGEQWNGQWTVTYDVVVSAPAAEGAPTATYSLTDEPQLSGGATLISGTATSDQLTDDVTWTDAGEVDIVPADAPATITAGAQHTYTVTLLVTVPLDTELPLLCDDDADDGLVNSATVTSGSTTSTSSDCGEVPELPTLTLLKSVENGEQTEGVAGADDWNLSASSEDFGFDGTTGVSSYVLPGEYDLSESLTDPAFAAYYYQDGAWVCEQEGDQEPPLELAAEASAVGGDYLLTVVDGSTADWTCEVTNRLVDPVEVVKTSAGVETTGTPGEWTVEYTLDVTNPNPVATVYDLTDVVELSEYVTLSGVEVTATPDGVTPDASFDGTAANDLIASGVEIGVGDPDGTHTYTVVATLTTAGATSTIEQCEVGNLNNEAVVTTGPAGEDRSDVCDEVPSLPAVNVEKGVSSTVQNEDGTWTVEYLVTATNSSDEYPTTYDAADTLQFGEGMTIVSADWVGQDGGDPTAFDVSTWTADLADGRDLVAGGVDEYTVTVVADVTTESTTTSRDCELVEGENGTGFLNSARVTVAGELTTSDTACDTPAVPDVQKIAFADASPVLEEGVWNGLWEVNYQIRVSNTGDKELVYGLEDVFTPSVGEIVGGTASGSTLAEDVVWDGTGSFDIVPGDAPQTLGSEEIHFYSVTLTVRTAIDVDLPVSCDDGGESGLWNDGVVTSGGYTTSDDDCAGIPELPTLTLVKTVDNGDLTEGVAGPGAFTLTGDGATTVSGVADADTGEVSGRAVNGSTYVLDEELTDETFEGYYYQDGEWVCESEGTEQPQLFALMLPTTPGSVTVDGDTTCWVTNVLVDPVEIEKTSAGAVASTENPGDWTVEYTLTVTNPNAVATRYDIDDAVELADGVELLSADVTGTPDGVAAEESFDGTAETRIASDVEVDAEGTHVYTVVAEVRASGSTGSIVACEFDNLNLRNAGTVTTGPAGTDTDRVCDEIPDLPEVDVVKTVVQGEGEDVGTEPSEDNDWTVEYTVEVTNSSDELPTTYSLTDSPMYGDGIDITSATWTGPNESSGEFTGDPLTAVLATDRQLAAGATETWTVTITSVVTTESTVESRDCELVEGENGTGFLNSATATAAGESVTDTACSTPKGVDLTIAKSVSDLPEAGEPVDAGDEFDYSLTVSHGEKSLNDATGVVVTDTMPAGLTVVDADAETDGVQIEGLPEGWTAVVAEDGSTVTFTYDGVFELGAEATLVFPVTVDEEPPGDFVNTACVESDETELDGSNNCDDVTTTVKRIIPNAEVVCSLDIPYLAYDIETINVENIEDETITMTWRDAEGEVIRVDEIPGTELQGRKIWPAGEVNSDGVSIGWPGWRPIVESDLDENGQIADPDALFWEDVIFHPSLESADWRPSESAGDEPLTVEFSVNPSATVEVYYPPADPECAVARDPEVVIEKTTDVEVVEGGDTFSYDLEVTNTGLGAVWDAVLTDEIPQDLKVTDWTTDETAFPRWFDCELTGTDSNGYGGVFTCDLFGPLAASDDGEPVSAPVVTLDVEVMENLTTDRIVNTGEVCWPEREPVGADDGDAGGCAESTVETPVRAIVPNAEMICLQDIPYVEYDIELFNVENPEGPITATWRDADGDVVQVDEIPLDQLTGRLLWPGGVVNEDGISIGWPGWREAREGETPEWENMVFDPDLSHSDYREELTVEFSVNPTSTLTVKYPPATPECAVVRDPDLSIQKSANVSEIEAGDSFEYTLEVVNNDLGAADDVTLTDEIPGHLRVDEIVTDTEAFPRWTDCEVTGTDSDGYGGTLECHLNGLLGRAATAPPVVLEVTTTEDAELGDAIHNTGQVCWTDSDKPDDGESCTTDDVTVVVSGTTTPVPPKPPLTPTLPKTGSDSAGILAAMAALLLLGSALVVGARRHRRS
ncbi:LPXTG-motif cell wall anchor domain-containing protein/conserved repeat domain-containing protein [Paraoerskovia marina]|uniref:LPXTG-motif cell wall anchor domain-containing protein/conserved repeat domain-containing protein n=1 Tax=Paraoerskovia marina TaxID=545619 RepID=A0A1H1V9X3_9CELL|nr:LPXTG cell wall anchor domain-containing protein [Paraoerskovia marina]SDS81547.1 LPXTG-motif cell wall anchor domain-containing protein/conserved repeat domain-containing protein [Paraoerskovia marina]